MKTKMDDMILCLGFLALCLIPGNVVWLVIELSSEFKNDSMFLKDFWRYTSTNYSQSVDPVFKAGYI